MMQFPFLQTILLETEAGYWPSNKESSVTRGTVSTVASVALIQVAVYAVSVEYIAPGNTTRSVVQMVTPTTIRAS